MSVRSAQSIVTTFTTVRFDTGAATNADSLPSGTLYVNGVANGAAVTVTNLATGVYSAAVTLPTLAVGDVVSIVIAATVNSVAGKGKIWEDSKDVFAGAIPDVVAGGAGGLFIAGANAATTFATLTVTGAVAFQSTFAVTTSTAFAALSATTITASGAVAFQSTVTASNASNNVVGTALTNAGIDAILDRAAGVETNYTLRQALRLILSSLVAKLAVSGTTVTIRDINDTVNRITATVDSVGQRTAVTPNP